MYHITGQLHNFKIDFNEFNSCFAIFPIQDGSADILIEGLLNRNKALNGDVVVITFLSADRNELNSTNSTENQKCKTVFFYLVNAVTDDWIQPVGPVEMVMSTNHKPKNKKKSPNKILKVKQEISNKSSDQLFETKTREVQENHTEICSVVNKNNAVSELPSEEENLKENKASNTSPQINVSSLRIPR